VAEGVLPVNRLARQLGSDYGDDIGRGIGQVVEPVRAYGYRAGQYADGKLQRAEYQVANYTRYSAQYQTPLAAVGLTVLIIIHF
jgi:hypothetical protein